MKTLICMQNKLAFISFQGMQSCNNNHLLLGANCTEDHPLMYKYTEHLTNEMEEIEGKCLKTERGHEVTFKFKLIPVDQKWVASMSGDLNNAATYFFRLRM